MSDYKMNEQLEKVRREEFKKLHGILANKDGLTDAEFLGLVRSIRDKYAVYWGLGALNKETKGIGAFSDFVKRACDVIESHYRIMEMQARTKALGTLEREMVSLTADDRETARKRMLKAVS